MSVGGITDRGFAFKGQRREDSFGIRSVHLAHGQGESLGKETEAQAGEHCAFMGGGLLSMQGVDKESSALFWLAGADPFVTHHVGEWRTSPDKINQSAVSPSNLIASNQPNF